MSTASFNQAPIGLIDSGVGGLTIARAIQRVLPLERMIYYADTAHLPYGNKSPLFIQQRVMTIVHHLEQCGCKMILVACNSASAQLSHLPQTKIPRMGVIVPVIQHLERQHQHIKKIGLIGTHATIASQAYHQQASAALRAKIHALATPLLAPMIENNASPLAIRQVLLDYGRAPALQHMDQLVLACTHYPLIRALMAEVYGSNIDILDTPTIVAQAVHNILEKLDWLCTDEDPEHKCLMSDHTQHFEHLAQNIFQKPVQIEQAI